MKCSKCGREIANDSNFCEYCGTKVGNNKKKETIKIVLIVLSVVIAMVGLGWGVYENHPPVRAKILSEQEVDECEQEVDEWVDLALPSGKLWQGKNESGYFTFDQAVSRFGKNLPSKEDFAELKSECKWSWTGSGMKVTGPNGNSIYLPAAGYRTSDGDMNYVGSYGNYWSSTPDGSEYAWRLYFLSGGVYMDYYNRSYGRSVRLVQDK